LIVIGLTAPRLLYAQADPGHITRDDARSLVVATLLARGYDIQSPKLEVDEEAVPSFPNFLFFGAYYDTPDRLARVGSFAVDPKTADLWDIGLCEPVKKKNVRRLQKILRLRYRLGMTRMQESPC